ncbi:MAG: hypothetical protein EAY75_14915 [Bacteroidetes bacterium]|nr:MAG: hypothetical protein EAY75_14915 [Bacteroidota bacterium]
MVLLAVVPFLVLAQGRRKSRTRPVQPPPAATTIPATYGLTASPTHFSIYFKWNAVPGAMFYRISNAAGKEIFDGGGLDAFDAILAPNQSFSYTFLPYNPETKQQFRPTTIAVRTASASVTKTSMVADYTELQNLKINQSTISGYPFKPADVGKCISIKGARTAPWYRQAPLWWHGTITLVDARGNATVGSEYGQPLQISGPISGYMGTNNYDAWRAELGDSAIATLSLSGTYLIDPYRSPWWQQNIKNLEGNTNQGPYLDRKALLISGGTLVFGQEDAIGQRLFGPPPPHYWQPMPLVALVHAGGTLGLACNIRGPKTVALQNRNNYPISKFYTSVANEKPKQIFFSGVFGDTTDYTTGFLNAFELRGPKPSGGKSVLALVNATIACAGPFGMGLANSADGVPRLNAYEGFRFLLRDTRVVGSGLGRATPTVQATLERTSPTEATIRVNKNLFPEFTFMQWGWSEPFNLLMKPVGAKPGGTHQFLNVCWRQSLRVVDPYTCVVPLQAGAQTNEHLRQSTLPMGRVELTTASSMQPQIAVEGHTMYYNVAELEINRVHLSGLNLFFIRQNGADNLQGSYSQWSIKNLSYTPPQVAKLQWMKTDWSYYLQMASEQAEPFIQHQGMGFVGKALISNVSKLMLHTHIGRQQYHIENSKTNLEQK